MILVGYSMGGETIRAFLAYSTHVGDGVANNDLDSVVLLHGVEQGSWLSYGSGPVFGALTGVLSGPLGRLIDTWIPSPNRLATQEFSPASSFMKWTDTNSNQLPSVPYYNTWGDERLAVKHCFVFGYACVSSDLLQLGDVVLQPGTDKPTQTPILGGERFLPNGYTQDSWQWDELNRIDWDPLHAAGGIYDAAVAAEIWNQPQQHTNYPNQQNAVQVPDCQTGIDESETTEIAKVIAARLTGSTYACNPAVAP